MSSPNSVTIFFLCIQDIFTILAIKCVLLLLLHCSISEMNRQFILAYTLPYIIYKYFLYEIINYSYDMIITITVEFNRQNHTFNHTFVWLKNFCMVTVVSDKVDT